METWKKPIWQVPLVLGTLGIVCRLLHYAGGILWGLYLQAQGPDPATGAITLTTGPVPVIANVLSCLLFWWAGWRFIRGLTRREVFWSASLMVLMNMALLAAEQVTQAVGFGFLAAYRLCALAEATGWVDQILFRLTGTVSVATAIPGLFAPYLYLIFGKKAAAAPAGEML